METLTINYAIAVIAIVAVISVLALGYSLVNDYRPIYPETIWVSFVCGLLTALGACLWLWTEFTTIALVAFGCGVLVYVVLLVIMTRESNFVIALWTATILSALFPVVALLSAVWFILKPKQRPSASSDRLSDTTDDDEDDDEPDSPAGGLRGGLNDPDDLEDLADLIGQLEDLRDQIDALEHQPAIDPDDLWDLRHQIDELVDAFNIGEPVHQIYIDELEHMRGRLDDLEDRGPLC